MQFMLKRLLITSLTLLLVNLPIPVSGEDHVNVYYAGPDGAVRTALEIADNFDVVEDSLIADVLVLNGVIPDPQELSARVQSGAGLVLIAGPELTSEHVGILLSEAVVLEVLTEPLSLADVENLTDLAVDQISQTLNLFLQGTRKVRSCYF